MQYLALRCKALASQFGNSFHYSDSDPDLLLWDAKQTEANHLCWVEPENSAEVAAVLRVLVDNWCQFAVKGGGHSRHPDDSNSVGGVTVDLNRISSVDLASSQTRARVGAGATGSQLSEPLSLGYVGPRTGSGGVAGFTLGGRHVVLANATVVTVAEQSNPDLFWALRGGANNFGIVTYFTLRVFPQGEVLDLDRSYHINVTDTFLKEAYEIFDVEISILWSGRYAQPVRDPPIFLEYEPDPAGVRNRRYWGSLASFATSNAPLGTARHLLNTITHYPSRELSRRAFEIFREEIHSAANVTGFLPAPITYSIPAGAITRMQERGGNALGLDVERHLIHDAPASQVIVNNLSLAWDDETDDERVMAFASRFLERYQAAARALGLYHHFIYVNYADKGQDVFPSYGESNKQRLIQIQQNVDPLGVFTPHGL
ncbi:hypothetical protein BJY01DRAFT_232235 [Aspergillus pseudoustus]|uniref:FAD-binding PCMH-type domain-containing protein n=1 Tax=Aspergillus pseudoustus TaxID=1810923 RepID=A0ABR4KN44_9EURO